MRAIDIGVGHDDDFFIAQIVGDEFIAGAAAERFDQVAEFLVAAQFVSGRAGDVEDLAPERQDRLKFTCAALLGGTAGAIAFDDKQLGPVAGRLGTVRKLTRQAQSAGCGLSFGLLVIALFQADFRTLNRMFKQHFGDFRRTG